MPPWVRTRHHPCWIIHYALIPMRGSDGQVRRRAGWSAVRWSQGQLGTSQGPRSTAPGMAPRRAFRELALAAGCVRASEGVA
jgi:hypothetical protein